MVDEGPGLRFQAIDIWKGEVWSKETEQARRESKIMYGITRRIYHGDADIHEQTYISRAYTGIHRPVYKQIYTGGTP